MTTSTLQDRPGDLIYAIEIYFKLTNFEQNENNRQVAQIYFYRYDLADLRIIYIIIAYYLHYVSIPCTKAMSKTCEI